MTTPRQIHEQASADPGVAELFGRLAGETSDLIRQELSLVTLEISTKLTSVMRMMWVMGAGVVVLVVGFEVLVYAGLIRLGMELPLWIAAGIVGASLVVIGSIVLGVGRSALHHIELLPLKTIETLKENKKWARQLVQ